MVYKKNPNKTVLVTGATGLIGSYLTNILLRHDYNVLALTRGDSNTSKSRLLTQLIFWNKLSKNKLSRLKIVHGDINNKDIATNPRELYNNRNDIMEIFHCAADIGFHAPIENLLQTNVQGTQHILDFALNCQQKSGFCKVNYLSTAYVCGDYIKTFSEDDLDVKQNFLSNYERSKFLAEQKIHDYREKNLWIDIYRPCIVIGDIKTGKIPTFNQAFYKALRLVSLNIVDYLPDNNFVFNLVPINELATSVYLIATHANMQNQTYHIFPSKGLCLKEVMDIFCKFIKRKPINFVSEQAFISHHCTPAQKKLLERNFLALNNTPKFSCKKTQAILEQFNFKFSTLHNSELIPLFSYAQKKGFWG